MRTRDIIISVLCVLLAASLLYVAQDQLDYINSARKEMKLISNEPLVNAPPSLAFASVAMGAFRGLVVDVLWMRADKLKMQGQFFDAKQLAEWITALQPRFAEVWDFQGWNMAYNISVAMPASQPAERWRWVRNGYELLRDQAIEKNPKNISLYRSLAWIFFHKMGGVTDDVHKYYKVQLAMAMQPLLMPETNEWYDKLAAAPHTWQQLEGDPQVTKFVQALTAADPNFIDQKKFVSNYLALRRTPDHFSPAAFATINKFRDTPELERFDVFAKAYELRNTWKLKPEFMVELNKRYGPMDLQDPNKRLPLNWEHPLAHSIYWGAMGLQVGHSKSEFDADEINTDRVVFHSLQELFRTGKMVIYDYTIDVDVNDLPPGQRETAPKTRPDKTVFLFQDLRMFFSYEKAMRDVIAKYKAGRGDATSIENGHRNMLTNAVVSFYQAGHQVQAAKIYAELQQLYPRPDFDVPIPVFVQKQVREMLQSLTINDASQMMITMLREGYLQYALRNDDEATARESMAQEIYDNYEKEWRSEKIKRVDVPEFTMIRYYALGSFLNDDMFPPNLRISLLERIKIERPQLYAQLEQQAKLLEEKARLADPNNQPAAN